HATADDDVIGALAKRDVDRDIGGMLQWRSHGVTLIPSVVGWAEGATAQSRARRASIHSSTTRSCGTSREPIVRSAVWYTGSRASSRRLTVATGSSVCSSGRSARRL